MGNPSSSTGDRLPAEDPIQIHSAADSSDELSGAARLWEMLVRVGLGETTLRIGTGVASLVLFLIVIWVMGTFYLKGQGRTLAQSAKAAQAPTEIGSLATPVYSLASSAFLSGIPRLASMDTDLPDRPRFDVTQYTVVKGDTIIGIAQKFNLKPQTILWGNYDVLADDPHRLKIGQVLNILPVDGTYYKWNTGDGLNGVAKYFSVSTDDIIDWPGNHLNRATLGDLANPKIAPGTMLMVPGGTREFISWSAPRITRSDPTVAKGLGSGSCGVITGGVNGTGTFIWPTTEKTLSGYDYSPEMNHYGIDIDGSEGNPIYAVDTGVVVYAGWNDYGYGNMVVLDHGNGWQTLYAHLSTIYVSCGQGIYQGATIGLMGTTGNSSGPHLHFEMRSDEYGRANPWDWLGK